MNLKAKGAELLVFAVPQCQYQALMVLQVRLRSHQTLYKSQCLIWSIALTRGRQQPQAL